jgi:putative membrane protein
VWILKLLFLFGVVLLGAAVAVLNAGIIHLDYYFGVVALPLSVVLVGAIGVGALLGVLASLVTSWELHRDNVRLRRKVRLTEQEVSNLRTLPLQDR